MFCINCGAEISNDAKFCSSCGTVVKKIVPVMADDKEEKKEEVVETSYNNVTSTSMMSAKATSIVAYMTWIGFIIAICAGDKEGARFYLNQALVFNIFCIACLVPVAGWLWGIYMLICFILGVIWAAEQEPKELPLIGKIEIMN